MSQTIQDLITALTGGDETRAEAAAAGLAALPEALRPEALVTLPGLLAASQADQRWWAVRALAALPAEDVVPLLLQALRNEDASVRQCALLGLRQRPDGRAIPELVTALDDPDPLVRRLAGDALEVIGSQAVPALLEVMASGSHPAQLEAARALAAIRDTRAVPALFEALDGSALLEHWASEGLERMGVGMNYFIPD